jgi:hypothetical protein
LLEAETLDEDALRKLVKPLKCPTPKEQLAEAA